MKNKLNKPKVWYYCDNPNCKRQMTKHRYIKQQGLRLACIKSFQ